MATNRSGFGDLIDPAIRKVWGAELDSIGKETLYNQIFHVESSTLPSEHDSEVGSFGLPTKTPERGEILFDDPSQGYDVTYTHEKFANGFSISSEMMEDDQSRQMKRLVSGFASTFPLKVETDCANVFNNAFSDTYPGGDGEALIDASHPNPVTGGTWSNHSVLAFDADGTAISTAITSFRGLTDYRGKHLHQRPDTIVIPPALADTVYKVLRTRSVPNSADNDLNPRVDGPLGSIKNILVWDYLTSNTAWFLLDSRVHRLNFFWRRKPKLVGPKYNQNTDTEDYTATMRYSLGFSGPFGIWGSTGAGA
jgi:phage major head subunit gpT-like protein